MQIILNGKKTETQQTTLDQLLVEQGYGDCSVATAVNDQFVPNAERANTSLEENFVIEVVAPMQGG